MRTFEPLLMDSIRKTVIKRETVFFFLQPLLSSQKSKRVNTGENVHFLYSSNNSHTQKIGSVLASLSVHKEAIHFLMDLNG